MFIENKKERLYAEARNNTKYNKDGVPTISKDDDWFDEDVWDICHYENLKN
jgi:hypothetical protein